MAISTSLNNSSVEEYIQGSLTLSDISDVDITALPILNNVLIGNGAEWISQALLTNLEVQKDDATVSTRPILNFGGSVVTVTDNPGNSSADVDIVALSPSQNLSDVSDTQTSLTNLLDTSNNIETTGQATVGTLRFNGSYYLSVNDTAITNPYVLEENTGNPQSFHLQFLDPDAFAASVNVDLPSPAIGSSGLSYRVLNTGNVHSIILRDAALTILDTILPGNQVQVVWSETSLTWNFI